MATPGNPFLLDHDKNNLIQLDSIGNNNQPNTTNYHFDLITTDTYQVLDNHESDDDAMGLETYSCKQQDIHALRQSTSSRTTG